MCVREPVEDLPALSSGGDDTGSTQLAQGLRDGCLERVGGRGEIADAELAGLEEGVEQAGARGVSEELEEPGGSTEGLLGQGGCSRPSHQVRLDVARPAGAKDGPFI